MQKKKKKKKRKGQKPTVPRRVDMPMTGILNGAIASS